MAETVWMLRGIAARHLVAATPTGRDDGSNPVIEGPLRRYGCNDGWGHRTVGVRQKPDRVHVSLDGIEVHDCYPSSEYQAIDHIGLTGPGEFCKAIENGEIEFVVAAAQGS